MTHDPFGDAPFSEGPRKAEVLRHLRASLVMRARALKKTTESARAEGAAEADRLLGIARDLAKSDEDGETFEQLVKSRGGVWFPSDDGLKRR